MAIFGVSLPPKPVRMPIVTLTTDFGLTDYYAGALKGALLRLHPALQLVDISHQIRPFDIVQGALVAGNAWHEFPEGTIHLIGVHCVYDEQPRFVVARHREHFFIAPDNGILTLLFDDLDPARMRHLPVDPKAHFAVKDVFAQTVAHLAEGRPLEDIGEYPGPLLQRIGLRPVITPSRIRGTVIHVDNFENVVLNIRREMFEQTANGRSFSLYFKRNDALNRLSDNYSDVPVGEPLCLFNAAGFLEIAVNLGKAATLLGLKVEDVVELTFE